MMTTGDILIVDDERDIRALIGATLRDEGYPTVEAATAGEARDILAAKPPGLAIFDIWMRDSDMDGLELLEWAKGVYPELPVLMISGHGTIETAVEAIRNGAFDFIEKPFKEDRLLLMVQRALEVSRLERENAELRQKVSGDSEAELVGVSSSIKNTRTAIERLRRRQAGFSSAARMAPERNWRHGSSIIARTGVMPGSSSPTARDSVRRVPMASCLVPKMSAPPGALSDCSSRRTRERSISMRSAICRLKPRGRSFERSPNRGSAGWAATRRFRSMCGSSRRLAATWRLKLPKGVFARISTTGWVWYRCRCLPLPSDARTSRILRAISSISSRVAPGWAGQIR